jgi:hypothetical protein
MIDRKFIGHEFKTSEKTITRWEISQFANAIRDDSPIYFNVEEAKKQGYRDLPVPPTFYTTMSYSDMNIFDFLGIDYKKLLAGGREFKYYTQCCAGDKIVYQTRVEKIVEKEGRRGKMDIVTVITTGKDKETNEVMFDHINNLIVFH